MISATSIALGMIAVQLRSAVAYAVISTFIFIAFVAAVFMSGGMAQWLLLLQSVLLFNAGIGAEVILLTLFEVFRRRRQARS
ncbi:hypothetical protein [Rhizobium sp. C4]|uniref:hypothetical protein n=1 Tax=Rhizobium sp. C4 TaxID=1349800 RepID=UPI001E4DBB88|nr:hypothetical protein [Rhizobium sp. C4]MCD2175382.1 hypothetical protein [Rhizobium sp. C4]